MSGFSGVVQELVKMGSKRPVDNRTTAIVTKVDNDGIVWVRYAGATSETPCEQKSVAVKVGDNVSITIKNGKSIIDGNFTTPATDDTKAKEVAKKVEDKSVDDGAVFQRIDSMLKEHGLKLEHIEYDEDGLWLKADDDSVRLKIANDGDIYVTSNDKETTHLRLGSLTNFSSIDFIGTDFSAISKTQLDDICYWVNGDAIAEHYMYSTDPTPIIVKKRGYTVQIILNNIVLYKQNYGLEWNHIAGISTRFCPSQDICMGDFKVSAEGTLYAKDSICDNNAHSGSIIYLVD